MFEVSKVQSFIYQATCWSQCADPNSNRHLRKTNAEFPVYTGERRIKSILRFSKSTYMK